MKNEVVVAAQVGKRNGSLVVVNSGNSRAHNQRFLIDRFIETISRVVLFSLKRSSTSLLKCTEA